MWPFLGGIQGLWLALYVLTFALHFVFVGYVAAGTGFALLRPRAPLSEQVRDRLPFMLGCGITAGVGPLLFIQLLYQRRFYTANLLMGPRWVAVVPALIIGFYGLYVAKEKPRFRRAALIAALGCFAFVAWSWSELHLVMQADDSWAASYGAGTRIFASAAELPRLVTAAGTMIVLFATVSAWSAADKKQLALIALGGMIVAAAGGAWLASGGVDPAHGWLYLLIAAAVAAAAGWIAVWRTGRGLALATGGVSAALVAGSVVREAARLALLEPVHDNAAEAGGIVLFLVTLAIGAAAITWIVRVIRA